MGKNDIDISSFKRKLLMENSEDPAKDHFANAEDNLYKKVTGEEPKASSKNKFRDVKESKLDTSTFIEPEEVEEILGKLYHIISGNRRDYLNIEDNVVNCLKQFDKTKYS